MTMKESFKDILDYWSDTSFERCAYIVLDYLLEEQRLYKDRVQNFGVPESQYWELWEEYAEEKEKTEEKEAEEKLEQETKTYSAFDKEKFDAVDSTPYAIKQRLIGIIPLHVKKICGAEKSSLPQNQYIEKIMSLAESICDDLIELQRERERALFLGRYYQLPLLDNKADTCNYPDIIKKYYSLIKYIRWLNFSVSEPVLFTRDELYLALTGEKMKRNETDSFRLFLNRNYFEEGKQIEGFTRELIKGHLVYAMTNPERIINQIRREHPEYRLRNKSLF